MKTHHLLNVGYIGGVLLSLAALCQNASAQSPSIDEQVEWRYGLALGAGMLYENLGGSMEAIASYRHWTAAFRFAGMVPDGGNTSALDLPRETVEDMALLFGYTIRGKKGILSFCAGPSLSSAMLRGPTLDSETFSGFGWIFFGPSKTRYYDTVFVRNYGVSIEAKGSLYLSSVSALGLSLFSTVGRSLVYSGLTLDITVGVLQ